MQVLKTRREVIQWAGAMHAFPVLRGSRPELSRPGDDEVGASRVGWKEFFAAFDHHRLVLVAETPGKFEHRFLERHQARLELPPVAFGPPLSERVWHEITLDKPPAPPAAG